VNAPLRIARELSGLEKMALLGGWKPGTVVLIMWGYFDESGEHDTASGNLRRLAMGGFYAPWSAIKALCVEWREALDVEGLGDFHMKEIASDEHNYMSWPPERRQRLDRFVGILCKHATHFGAFSYPVQDPDHAFVQAYKPGLSRALIHLEGVCIESGQRGNIVFAQTEQISNELIGRYFDGANWDGSFDGFAVRKSRNEPALQAAEIVARGMKRFMQDGGITYSFSRIRSTLKPIMFWPQDPTAALSAEPSGMRKQHCKA